LQAVVGKVTVGPIGLLQMSYFLISKSKAQKVFYKLLLIYTTEEKVAPEGNP
jgi:hypothetical protein